MGAAGKPAQQYSPCQLRKLHSEQGRHSVITSDGDRQTQEAKFRNMDSIGVITGPTNQIIIEQAINNVKTINKKNKLSLAQDISSQNIVSFLETVGKGQFYDKTLEYNFQTEIIIELTFKLVNSQLICSIELSSDFEEALSRVMIEGTYNIDKNLILSKVKETGRKQNYTFKSILLLYAEDLEVKIHGRSQKVRANSDGKITFDDESQTLDFSVAVPPLPQTTNLPTAPPLPVPDFRVPPPTIPCGSARRDLFGNGRPPLHSALNRNIHSSSDTSREEDNIADICDNIQRLQTKYQREHTVHLPASHQKDQRQRQFRGTGARRKNTYRVTHSNDYESIDETPRSFKRNPKTSTPKQKQNESNAYQLLKENEPNPSDPDFLPQQLVKTFFESLSTAQENKNEQLTYKEATKIAKDIGLFQLPSNSDLSTSECMNLLKPVTLDTSTETEEEEVTFKAKKDTNNESQDEY